MHFWIDKRSSQLHQYGGGRRGAGGFYSQNFGTHRGTHHPPPSLAHHHPHRIRSRSSSTNNAIPTGGGNNPTNNINNNNTHQSPSSNATSSTSTSTTNGNNSANIALQYPHQQPHQVQQQHAHLNHASSRNLELGNSGNVSAIAGTIGRFQGRSSEGFRHGNALLSQAAQQQPILGGGILAITGSSSNAAAALNPPMAIVSGDDGESGGMSATTVLTFPPSATGVNRSNSINVQLISCVNINPENRGGIDLSWRNPYPVPGSISRSRAYSREIPPSLVGSHSSATSSRGTRGRRTSSSSSSAFGRNSLGTTPATTVGASSNHSQNVTNETPDVMTDRSTRSERTLFDRDTATPRSLSLTSPETGGEQSSRGTSTGGRPSLENDPGWACTKRVGLTLCFLAFILLGTVGAKFMIQGPGVIDTGKAEAAAYFLFTELIFVAFAMALFFTGVACLRKRTNDYLLRQFNQYIMNTSGTPPVPGGTMGGIPGQDAYDFEYYDGAHPPINSGSPSSRGHHHHLHHNLHHGGFHHYRHHRSSGSLIEEGDLGGDLSQSPHNFNGAGPIHYPAHYGSGSNGNNRHGRSKPPPYHIALYLPLPEMGGGGNSPTEENDTTNNNENHERSKSSNGKSSDSIGFIDSSSIKDAQDAAGGNNVNYSGINNSSENRDSNSRNEDDTNGQENRSETPPPPYEQL